MTVNINNSLFVSLEVVNALVAILLLYGLLFCPSSFIVFLCIFIAVFGIFLGQVSHSCLVNHLQCTMNIIPETTPQNRFQTLSHGIGKTVLLDPTAIYLVLLVMMHIVVLLGFVRLYNMLSKKKGFL